MKELKIKCGEIKDITAFTPEKDPNNSNIDVSLFIKLENGKLLFEIFSFRYLIKYIKNINNNESFFSVLPLKKFQDIIKIIKDDEEIIFKFDEKTNYVKIFTEKVEYTIKKMDNVVKPQIDEKKEEEIKINGFELLRQIKKTKFAIANDIIRYYLNGVNLELYKNKNNEYKSSAIATNSAILAISNNKEKSWELIKKNNIIPKQVISDVIKILEKGTEETTISFNKNTIYIKSGDFESYFKLIEAEYPDIDRVIPTKNEKIAKINTQNFKTEINKVSPMSDENKDIKLIFTNNKLDLETNSINGDEGKSYIETEYNSENITIKVNSKYLIDILDQVDNEFLLFKMDKKDSPILIEQEGNKDLFIVMPISND